MEDVFGAVKPFTIMMVITLLTQWVKANWELSPKQIQFVALGFSILLIGAWQLLTIPDITPLAVFVAFIFALLGWFTAIGMYEVATKQLVNK